MGKTRMEELFYELYASSKQHDSWQRYEMILELRELMKQPKGSGSDHFERAHNDEDLVETEVATDPIEIEHGTLNLVPEAQEENKNFENHEGLVMLEEEPISPLQVHVSQLERGLQIHYVSPTVCEDSQYVVGCDELFGHQEAMLQVSHVKVGDELLTKSTDVTNNQAAHYLFDKMSLRVQSKRRQIKCHKSWRFKFKERKQRRGKLRSAHKLIHRVDVMEDDHVYQEGLPLWLLVRFRFWKFKFINRKLQKVMREHGHFSHPKLMYDKGEHDELFTVAKAVSKRSMIGITFGIRESNAGEDQRAVCEQSLRQISLVLQQVMRSKKIKFTKQWMFKFRKKKIDQWLGYNLIVAYLRNKKTWAKLRVRELDNLTWEEDASDESWNRSRIKPGEAMITCKHLLEKSYDKNVEIVAWSRSPERSEISCEVEAFGDQESTKFRKFAVAFMDISTVAKTQGLRFVHVLHKDAVLDSKLGYLMGNMMEEDQKQQGDSELLVIVLECVEAKGGFGMDKKPLHLSLRNRVWDPGGCLENLEVKVSSKEGDLLQVYWTWAGSRPIFSYDGP